jgi:hypothetical protein
MAVTEGKIPDEKIRLASGDATKVTKPKQKRKKGTEKQVTRQGLAQEMLTQRMVQRMPACLRSWSEQRLCPQDGQEGPMFLLSG